VSAQVLATFIDSSGGLMYAKVCERWGRDPAAWLEAEDDVLAHNLRLGLTLRLAEDAAAESDEGVGEDQRHRRMVKAAREAVGRVRAMTG
jgi:hypothetical protein